MKTVAQTIKMYEDVFSGKTVLSNGYTITSDGVYWIVDGNRGDTIQNHKRYLERILNKCSLARNIVTYLGDIDSNILDDYNYVYDVCGDMILFYRKDDESLTFIYIVSSYVAVEQIDICFGTMKYNRFWREQQEMKHGSISGKLSVKSKEMLLQKFCCDEGNTSITQNFFYDMYLEGMNSYLDFANAIASSANIHNVNLLSQM